MKKTCEGVAGADTSSVCGRSLTVVCGPSGATVSARYLAVVNGPSGAVDLLISSPPPRLDWQWRHTHTSVNLHHSISQLQSRRHSHAHTECKKTPGGEAIHSHAAPTSDIFHKWQSWHYPWITSTRNTFRNLHRTPAWKSLLCSYVSVLDSKQAIYKSAQFCH